MDAAVPPPISSRSKYFDRRRSLSTSARPRTTDSNYGQLPPASPEVISSLITSLSIISTPANELFEGTSGSFSMPTSPAVRPPLSSFDRHSYNNGSRISEGSFGLDYGAFKQPLNELEEDHLDELAASPPVVRTSKPPSGFSPLTAPKSPASRDTSPFKSFIRGGSRGGSRRSSLSSTDDVSSIGSPSVEAGIAQSREVKRQSSGESWSRKQRNSKGLMYMSSRERLREREQERVSNRASSGDRLQGSTLEMDTFMAQTPINEEPVLGPIDGHLFEEEPYPAGPSTSPHIGRALSTDGAVAFQRPIPIRDSSLRNYHQKKRSSKRSSEIKGKEREGTDRQQSRERHRSREETKRDKADIEEMTQKLHEPLATPHATRTQAMVVVGEDGFAGELEEGAPSPAVAQRRRSRQSVEGGSRSASRNRLSGAVSPEPQLSHSKSTSTKIKRLSAPLGIPTKEKERTQRDSRQATSKRVTSPEPGGGAYLDDRMSDTDSIDDAVEAYLRSPRLTQKIKHPHTGRTISFSEVGDSEGHAVFCCVGMGLTRYIMAFYDELALTLKLRLITPDRPGVGESEPYTDGTATPLSWPDDVYAICQTLKITKFSILAHSAGAIYALATALRMPQHIRGRIHLLAPWIPPSQMNVIGTQQVSPPANSIPTSQRILRALPTPMLKVANSSFMSATSSSLTSSLPKKEKRSKRKSTASTNRDLPTTTNAHRHGSPGFDKENIDANTILEGHTQQANNLSRDPMTSAANAAADKERQLTYDTRLTHAIWELATTGANPAVDLLVCLERRHTIGFRYVDITKPVMIRHGSRDTRVPVENVKWLGKTMRKCEVRVLEGEGHGLMASATVMGSVLMDISKEWDDWVNVTTNKGKEDRSRLLRERASVGAFR